MQAHNANPPIPNDYIHSANVHLAMHSCGLNYRSKHWQKKPMPLSTTALSKYVLVAAQIPTTTSDGIQ